ncbi:MAG: PEP-CTERM sorting domain-containing protein [Verrucomicrobiota bacterium]|nr:PEP-CTERM sorting domain-containing protein [Verrucomicrobiota bacterium]
MSPSPFLNATIPESGTLGLLGLGLLSLIIRKRK